MACIDGSQGIDGLVALKQLNTLQLETATATEIESVARLTQLKRLNILCSELSEAAGKALVDLKRVRPDLSFVDLTSWSREPF